MCRKYSTRSATRRWPVHMFFNILDLASVNSWVIFKEVTNSKISRKKFMERLVEEVLGIPMEAESTRSHDTISRALTTGKNLKRKHFQISKDCKNKLANVCFECKRSVCGKCCDKITICISCAKKLFVF